MQKTCKKVLTIPFIFDKIIFADAVRNRVEKAKNLDNWTVKQPWKIIQIIFRKRTFDLEWNQSDSILDTKGRKVMRFMLAWKKHKFETCKTWEGSPLGRTSNGFRIVKARSAEQSVVSKTFHNETTVIERIWKPSFYSGD